MGGHLPCQCPATPARQCARGARGARGAAPHQQQQHAGQEDGERVQGDDAQQQGLQHCARVGRGRGGAGRRGEARRGEATAATCPAEYGPARAACSNQTRPRRPSKRATTLRCIIQRPYCMARSHAPMLYSSVVAPPPGPSLWMPEAEADSSSTGLAWPCVQARAGTCARGAGCAHSVAWHALEGRAGRGGPPLEGRCARCGREGGRCLLAGSGAPPAPARTRLVTRGR